MSITQSSKLPLSPPPRSGSPTTGGGTFATAGSLNLPPKHEISGIWLEYRDQTKWCWSSITSSLVRHFSNNGTTIKQCDIANAVLNVKTCCKNGRFKNCNKLYRLDLAIKHYNHFQGWQSGSLAASNLQKNLINNKPVGVRIQWRSQNFGHFILIVGYSGSGSFYIVLDPEDPTGQKRTATDADLRHNYDGDGDWDETILTCP